MDTAPLEPCSIHTSTASTTLVAMLLLKYSLFGGSLTPCYSNWRCSYRIDQQIDFLSHVIHNNQQLLHIIFNQIFFILSTTTLPVVSYPQRDLLLHLFCNDICCCISSATRYVVVFFIASISATRELLVIPKIHE